MPAARLMRDALAGRATAGFVGRRRELELLAEFAKGEGPALIWLHGLAGMGKTALLREFSHRQALSSESSLIRLDCRLIEPSPEGFLLALQNVLQPTVANVAEAADALSFPAPAILILDSYEALRLLDGWMRQEFVPALKESVRVVICGRYAPGPAWQTALEWHGLLRSISLAPLSECESVALLERAGTAGAEAISVYRSVGGHPLALVLAGATGGGIGGTRSATGSRDVVRQLTQLYLAEVSDPNLRTVVEAASLVRRVTQSLLAAMVPDLYDRKLYDELSALSIAEATSEGLRLPEQVQNAVSSWLRSSDPRRFYAYRRAAWRQVRTELRDAAPCDRWRSTADMLYLVENPGLRNAYFPTGAESLSVERAGAGDRDAILAIANRHERPSAAAAIAQWWQAVPDSFYAMRDDRGELAGFYMAAELLSLRGRAPESDPAMKQLQRHLQAHPLAENETALFLRRWLNRSDGESPSAVQAACWLDVKRFHLALRPRIRRCYGTMIDVDTFAPMLGQLGFVVVDAGSPSPSDAPPFHLLMLDFGPGSFDGWLSGLVAREMGIEAEEFLDTAARELISEEGRVPLTPLEFGVLAYLRERQGKAVSRAELLERVWARRVNAGSNVIDVVIRSLRKKLGARSRMLSTVRGVGYRFRSLPPS